MDTSATLMFLVLVVLGSYIQTVSGFAIALVIIGGVTLMGLASVAFTANVVSFIALANTAVALYRNHGQVDGRILLMACIGIVPLSGVGLYALGLLSEHAHGTLELLLGAMILASGSLLLFRPHPRKTPSNKLTYLVAGGVGGFINGLFGAGGPPVVIHLYRQPVPFAILRSTLLAVLAIMTITRISFETYNGHIDLPVLQLSLLMVPASVLTTLLTRRFPPAMSDLALRRLSFGLLSVLGLSLLLMKS